jgi:ArsR family transcriptional regulator
MTVACEQATLPEKLLDAELAALAKALGHPARVRILRLLLARDSCFCGEIVVQLPLAQATVSQHLKVLKEAGLIQGEIDGPRSCYCADRERLAELRDLFGGVLADAAELEEDGRCGCR